jgi:3-methyl-2-oxobutanoate hydroxymethyltransferase
MTAELAQKITGTLPIPTIGIGAGAGCDGQVLVWSDLVGLSPTSFKFVKQYARTRELWAEAARGFVSEVASGQFPGQENTYYMREAEAEKFQSLLQGTPDEPKTGEPALESESNREDRGLLQEVERIWRGD